MMPDFAGIEPEFLFHYTSFSSFLSILQTGTLWATELQYLNDSQELQYALRIAELFTQLHLKDRPSQVRDWVAEQVLVRLRSIPTPAIFEFSFSEAHDLLSQWRAYCPKGGLSFGIGKSVLAELGVKNGFRLVKCAYDYAEQASLLAPIMESAVENLAGEYPNPIFTAEDEDGDPWIFRAPWTDEFLRLAPQLKSSYFQEEKEWRLVSDCVDNGDPRLGFHTTPSFLFPHLALDIREGRECLPIDSVTISPQPHARLLVGSVLLALERSGIKYPRVGSSRIPYRQLSA